MKTVLQWKSNLFRNSSASMMWPRSLICVYKWIHCVIYCCCIVQLGYIDNHGRYARDDSSASDDGGDSQSTVFIIGSGEYLNQIPPATSTSPPTPAVTAAAGTAAASTSVVTVTSMPLASNTSSNNHNNNLASSQINSNIILTSNSPHLTSAQSVSALSSSQNSVDRLVRSHPRTHAHTLDPPFWREKCRHSCWANATLLLSDQT